LTSALDPRSDSPTPFFAQIMYYLPKNTQHNSCKKIRQEEWFSCREIVTSAQQNQQRHRHPQLKPTLHGQPI
jgi:hypothetical protein